MGARIENWVFRTTISLAVAAAVAMQPFTISYAVYCSKKKQKVALADDGGGRGGGSGSGGNSGSNDGHSGHGGGDKSDDGDHAAEDTGHQKSAQPAGQHRFRLGLHGEKIEIDATGISIVYPDGFTEDIRNGMLELK